MEFEYIHSDSLNDQVEGLSCIFIVLNNFLFIIVSLLIYTIKSNKKQFIFLLVLLNILISASFYTKNILFFFMAFEAIVIPMGLIILLWGNRNWEKVRATLLLSLFTVFSGYYFLCAIVILGIEMGTFRLEVLYHLTLGEGGRTGWVILLCFMLSFIVKLPLMPAHIWLTQAHVEAPMIGSVLLAGILLKIGGYGMIAYGYYALPYEFNELTSFLKMLALLSMGWGSTCTCMQTDIKRLIAYSSVAHMAMCVYPLFNQTEFMGVTCCVVGMIAHGLVSPGLFIVVGILYERKNTRNIGCQSGLNTVHPVMGMFAFVLTLCSMGVPGTLNFVGELYLVSNVINCSNSLEQTIVLYSMILGLIYSLKFFLFTFYGTPMPSIERLEVKRNLPYITSK